VKKLTGILLIIVLNVFSAFTQLSKWLVHQTNGQLHLVDFTTTPPQVSIPSPGYGNTGDEDVNLMTDAAGNILFSFFCNGSNLIEVRDRNWNIMPNGTGLFGNESSLKSCIVKVPCSTNLYYIIHLRTGTINQLYYSILDMSANGGLGDVIQRNIFVADSICEGLSVTHQMNNGCRWLLAAKYGGNKNEVCKLLISATGIGTPVTMTTINYTVPSISPLDLQVSHDNSKLVMSTLQSIASSPDILVWDFDLNAGDVSNAMPYNVSSQPVIGVEFSPDNSKLYWRTNMITDNSELGRIDLITGTVNLIDNNFGRFGTAIETASNGKLYMAHNYNINYLSEIADPNNPNIALIGFTYNAVFISSTGCRVGLPNDINGEFPGTSVVPNTIDFSYAATTNCHEYIFIDSTCLGTWWEWDFGDSVFSNLENPVHQFQHDGNFNVTLRAKICSDTISLTKSINVTNNSFTLTVSPDAVVCNGNSVNLFANGGIDYEWSPSTGINATTGYMVIANPTSTTIYTVIATDGSPCSSSETITVSPVNNTVSIFSSATQACSGTSITLVAIGTDMGIFNWSNGSINDSINVTQSGNYIVQYTDSSCTAVDSVQINFYNIPAPQILTTLNSKCEGDTSRLFLINQYLSQQWYYNGSLLINETNTDLIVNSSGTYSVSVTDSNGCTGSTGLPVVFQIKPDAVFNTNVTSCIDSLKVQNASANANDYEWYVDGILMDTTINPYLSFATIGNHVIELVASNGNCRDTSMQTIFISPKPKANFYTDSTCSLSKNFHNTSTNGNQYLWLSENDTISTQFEPSYTFTNYGLINIKLITINQSGCKDSIEESIEVINDVPASFEYLLDTCAKKLLLSPNYDGAFEYDWHIDNKLYNNTPNPVIKNFKPGSHFISLIVNRGFSCEDSTIQNITIDEYPETHFYIPNTFTPNDDGLNEEFKIFGLGYCDQYDLFIYNRWGELIFETNDTGPNWNGFYKNKKVESGVYSYVIKFDGRYLQGIINVLY
jgi:gliding motility-associated-like protein